MTETKAEKAEAKAEAKAEKAAQAAADDITNRIVIQTTYQEAPNVSRYEGYVYFDKDEK